MDANVRTLKEKLQCTADHLQLKRISGGKLLNKQQLTTATQPAWRMGSQALIVSRARESRYEQEVRDRNWIEDEVSAAKLLFTACGRSALRARREFFLAVNAELCMVPSALCPGGFRSDIPEHPAPRGCTHKVDNRRKVSADPHVC
jgi:hypothetical protein